MSKKATYSKLGAAALFGSPSAADAQLVYFDIPDTTLPAPVNADYLYVLKFDLNEQSAVLTSTTPASGNNKSIIAGTPNLFSNFTLEAYSNYTGKYGTVSAKVPGPGGVNTKDAIGYTYPQIVGNPTKNFPKPSESLNRYGDFAYYDGDGLYFSPYFPNDNSTNFVYFENEQAHFGWLELSISPTGELTVYGVHYEPIPETSINLVIITALGGSAFIYSRRKRKKKQEQDLTTESA